MKTKFLLVLFVCPIIAMGQTTYNLVSSCTVATCNWDEGSSWEGGVAPNGTIASGSIINIPEGTGVNVRGGGNKIEISTVGNGPMTLNTSGLINISSSSARILLPSNATLNVGEDASFNAGNNSTILSIGSSEVRGDDIEDLFGPNTYSQDNLESGGCANPDNNCAINPLPVTLLFLKPSYLKHKVKIYWATASEENFHYFELSRSTNGLDFDKIARIDSKSQDGYSNIRQDYVYIDNQPYKGLNYYQLSSVDYDGYTEIFPMIAVQANDDLNPMVFPNPVVSSTINISGLSANNPYSIAIYTLSGQKKFEAINQFQNTIEVGNTLSKGIYIARIAVGEQVFNQCIIVE